MSLIDEALKRAQEAARAEGAKSEPRPWTPAPQPDAGLARRRRLVRAAGWILGAAAALVAGSVLVRLVWDASAPAPDPVRAAAEAAPPTPAPTLAETIVSTPIPASAAVSARPRLTAPSSPESPAAEAPAAKPAESVPAPAPAPRPIADGRSYVGSVELPGGARIELGGIVWSEEEPRALLNDRIVATDAYVEGFTVSKIEENRVVLVRDGVTIYLTIK